MAYVDLHFHLLPGVDDGPEDMAASLDLARAAVADGTGTVVATPHVRTDLGLTDAVEIRARVLELRFALATEGIPLEVRCGGELGHEMVGRMRQSELELLAQGPSGGRWVLVETPFHGIGADFHAATAELRERGFGVLVAHPERSADASLDGAAGLRRELAAGSLAQVNAQSLTGDHGEESCSAAWELIAEGLISVVASDAHGPTRPPALKLARNTLLEVGVSPSAAAGLIGSTPHRLLATGIASPRAIAA
ncbi:MAG: protein tyrosine phosphatase [Thermoleophilaceae bacterium]|nr:protein tyrosine phosphatase [Thermoleophilaceae bacterium]